MSAMVLSTTTALLLFVLCVLVLLKDSRQGRVPLAFALLLLALVGLFDSFASSNVEKFMDYKRLVLFCNSLIPAAFLLYGTVFTRRSTGGSKVLAMAPLLVIAAVFSAAALLLPMDQFFSSINLDAGGILVLGQIGYWFYLGLMVFCIAALVNLESVFAGVRGMDRWRVKYEFLGVGSVLSLMIFLFSQGLLYKAVNMSLLPVQSTVAMVAALLIGYSRLYRGKTASLAVSRQALYRSFTLVAVGLYLLVLGIMGEGMRWFNITVTQDLLVLVAILSGITFLVLLFSVEIRRRLKVLIAKHFYAQKHDYREEWLGISNVLAGCRDIDDVRAAIVHRYQQLFGLHFAVLYAREGGGDSFALAAAQDRRGMPERVTLSSGLRGYFSETGRVMNPTDGEYTLTVAESSFVRDTDAWLLVPLMAGEHLEAFVIFGRRLVPEKLTYEDFDLMKIIGRQAVLSLKNFQLAEELTEAREMAAVAKVSSFVIHDLKNLAYTFSLMMENVESHIGEADFQKDLVKSIRSTVTKMHALIAKLKAFPEKIGLKRDAVDLAGLVQETLDEMRKLKPTVNFESALSSAKVNAEAAELRKVVLNLLLNACDAGGETGQVRVTTACCDADAVLSVEDNGSGMSPAFVQGHLFKPFRTTKEKGLGIGLYQCKQIVEAHGGRIEVESREGAGAVFTVVLPGAGSV